MCAENIHIYTGDPISNLSPDNPLQTHDTSRCVPHMLIFLEQEHIGIILGDMEMMIMTKERSSGLQAVGR